MIREREMAMGMVCKDLQLLWAPVESIWDWLGWLRISVGELCLRLDCKQCGDKAICSLTVFTTIEAD